MTDVYSYELWETCYEKVILRQEATCRKESCA